MKKITFTIANYKKVERFLGAELYSFHKIGCPEATFHFPKKEGEYRGKGLKLIEGCVIFKNKKGDILLKVN